MAVSSAFNVVVPLGGQNGQNRLLLFNTLAGSLDVIDSPVSEALAGLNGAPNGLVQLQTGNSDGGKAASLPSETWEYLDRRGYLFDSPGQERTAASMLYEELLKFHRQALRQPVIVIPTYHCNLKCSYCWQHLRHLDSPVISEDTVNRLFGSLPEIVENYPGNGIDLTVFGGEPLQNEPELMERVLQILELARARSFSTQMITNGVALAAAVPSIAGRVDLIQVTIDGPPALHRRRRILPGGDSFTPMAEGVSRALAAGIRINVRVNVDFDNLNSLPELADVIRERGWLDSGLARFHLVPIKNHNPRRRAAPEAELLNAVLDLRSRDERMSIYILEGFAGLKYFEGFKQSGLLPLQRFFHCEAQLNFLALDLDGYIYACWDAAGIPDLAVGHFLPEVKIDPLKLAQWRGRNALHIDGCDSCTAQPNCGGGCQFLALEHGGNFLSPSCDSLMEGYKQAILANREWLLERARLGDHAVGLVTAQGVITPVTREFGLLEVQPTAGFLDRSC